MKSDDIRRLVDWKDWQGTEEQQRELAEKMRAAGVDWAGIYQEIEMSERYVNTHMDVSVTGSVVAMHSHSFYELLLCETNSGVEYLVGNDRYRVRRGDVIFLPPGVSHQPLFPETLAEPYRRTVIWASQEFMDRLLGELSGAGTADRLKAGLLRTAGTAGEDVIARFHAGVREATAKDPGWQLSVAANTALLLIELSRLSAKGGGAPERPELLERVLAYIEEHLAEPISLSETARHFWVSESTVGQTFRQRLGVSFYRCVTQRRLIAAKALMLQGVPLGEINERVGFSDYSTFYRAFKGEFGVSPRQFRQVQGTSKKR